MKEMQIPEWKRAVIKVGSSIVAPFNNGCSTSYLLAIAGFIIESRRQGKEIILVSSGAVAAGYSARIDKSAKGNLSIPEQQALAAIGQPLLMEIWSRLFDFPCAQILITYDAINNRHRFINTRNTIHELLRLYTFPIVNENDTVAVDELKVGDKYNLAAHVAVISEADLLIICSDIDGLFNDNPNKNKNCDIIREVKKIDRSIYNIAGSSNNPVAKGGMFTKIQAAEKATSRGISTIIVNGKKKETFDELLKGNQPGTIFRPISNPLASKKHWMMHALKPCGIVVVDDGARKALIAKGASLLPSGVVDVIGTFSNGEAVEIRVKGNEEVSIAKGIVQYSSSDLAKIKGLKSKDIESVLGYTQSEEIIHRNDLIIFD
jgi:glutamate 5-kinase